MLELSTLPDLPLLLAGLPQQVLDLLSAVGVPAQNYVAGATDVGRFVLFDSRRPFSVQQARQARRAGRRPIDIANCGWPAENLAHEELAEFSGRFIQRLKEDLETQGGLWLRIADFPFPFQSAMCLALDYGPTHQDDELPALGTVAGILESLAATGTQALPVTHFVPSQLRGEALIQLRRHRCTELGWMVDEDSLEGSVRKTVSHWTTRQQRFQAAGLSVDGLWLATDESGLPGTPALNSLGFAYSASALGGQSRQATVAALSALADWTRFGALSQDQWLRSAGQAYPRLIVASGDGSSHVLSPAPARSPVTQALSSAYRSGQPIFLHHSATQTNLAAQLAEISSAAATLPRLWQASHRQFARWWMQRMALQLRVWKEAVGYSIQFRDLGLSVPAVELWRGQHRAVLPITQPQLTIHDAEVAFVHTHNGSPGGLAAPLEAPSFVSTREALRPIPQSVESA